MTRGIVYKGIFILVVILFAIILVLPTLGTKTMDIFLEKEIQPGQVENIMQRFSSDNYNTTRIDDKIEVMASGINITDAVMNEAKVFPGVKDVKILPHWAEKAFLAKKVTFGLDLQGGMHLVLMADFEKIKKDLISERDRLLGQKASLEAKGTGDKANSDIDEEKEEIEFNLKDINENKLTSEGELRESYKSEITSQALEMLRNRVDKFGVSEPSILPRGNEAIEIQLPGVKDPASVKKAIGTTGSVQYRLVDDAYTAKVINWLAANYKNKILPETTENQEDLLSKITEDIKLPADLELLFYYRRDEKTNKLYPTEIMALQRKVALAGSDMSKAWVGRDEYGALTVQFRTTSEGASKFAKVTAEENRGKRMAIIIDDKIRSAPSIREQIVTGNAVITGDFTIDEVTALSRIIQEGALPVELTKEEERTVGPSLGQDSIESGFKAILVGLAGIFIFMIFYYKFAGIISVIGLILNSLFLFALLSWLGFTLTMPGMAGFILNAGMAIDANVIIYERIKEELKSGKSVRMSIVNGFDRAFWAIFDSNITTLISAFVLTQYGTGPVKGFAVTLCMGIISTMFVALYITKFIYVNLITLKKDLKKLSI